MREGIRYIESFERACDDAVARPKAYTRRSVYRVFCFDCRKLAFLVRAGKQIPQDLVLDLLVKLHNTSLIVGVAATLHVALCYPPKFYAYA